MPHRNFNKLGYFVCARGGNTENNNADDSEIILFVTSLWRETLENVASDGTEQRRVGIKQSVFDLYSNDDWLDGVSWTSPTKL